jgi:hypothetical protein
MAILALVALADMLLKWSRFLILKQEWALKESVASVNGPDGSS